MSHSQFHCIPFILRHAWLNLLDERMTTGRINQVAIVYQTARQNESRPTLVHNNGQWLGCNHCSCGVVSSRTYFRVAARAVWIQRRHRPLPIQAIGMSPPPSFDSFVNIPPRQHPSNKDSPAQKCETLSDTSAVCVRHQRYAATSSVVRQ